MSEQNHIEKCKQCNTKLFGPFCSNCGQPQTIKRINGDFILSEISNVLNVQKGIFFTIKELLIRPGISVKKFIYQDRNLLVKPISFIILCSLVYILLQRILHFNDEYISTSELNWGDSSIGFIMTWINNNYGFANILMAYFIALWIKVFFRKHDYNIFEILILLYFLMGIQMLMFSLFGIIESIIHLRVGDKGSIIIFIYFSWAIGQFFDFKKKTSYLKVFFSYLLGMISFLIVAVLCGVIVDWIV